MRRCALAGLKAPITNDAMTSAPTPTKPASGPTAHGVTSGPKPATSSARPSPMMKAKLVANLPNEISSAASQGSPWRPSM